MALTPEDIANKDFSRSLRGFNENEVNDFLDEINDNYARTLDDNAALKNQLAAAQEKVKYFSGLQDALNKSILIAQQTADQVKKDAEKERDRIIYDAENDSKKILKAATDKANQIQDEAIGRKHELLQKGQAIEDGLKKFHQQLLKTLQGQLNAANDQDWIDLLESHFSNDLASFKHYKSSDAYDDVTKSLLQENPDLKLDVNQGNLADSTTDNSDSIHSMNNFNEQAQINSASSVAETTENINNSTDYNKINDYQMNNKNESVESQLNHNVKNFSDTPEIQSGDPGFMVNSENSNFVSPNSQNNSVTSNLTSNEQSKMKESNQSKELN